MELLWGVTIGCISLISLTILIAWSNKTVQIYQEQKELRQLCRTVLMALNNMVGCLQMRDAKSASFHLQVAKMRYKAFPPVQDELNKELHKLLGLSIDFMQLAYDFAEQGDAAGVRDALVKAASAYNSCIRELDKQIAENQAGNED